MECSTLIFSFGFRYGFRPTEYSTRDTRRDTADRHEKTPPTEYDAHGRVVFTGWHVYRVRRENSSEQKRKPVPCRLSEGRNQLFYSTAAAVYSVYFDDVPYSTVRVHTSVFDYIFTIDVSIDRFSTFLPFDCLSFKFLFLRPRRTRELGVPSDSITQRGRSVRKFCLSYARRTLIFVAKENGPYSICSRYGRSRADG